MNFYKGIDLDRNVDVFNYISTYHNSDHELKEAYMESDPALQQLVNRYHLKSKLLITLFNLSIYVFLYSIIWLIK